MARRLQILNKKGKEVLPGDIVIDFRGDNWIFVKVSRPPGEWGTPKVIVHPPDERKNEREFYSNVFGLDIYEVDDPE